MIKNVKDLFPNSANSQKSDVSKLEKIIPGLSAVVGVVVFLSGLFGGSSDQSSAYDINLTSTGSLVTTDPYKSVIFENPGSANLSLNPPTLINYNNTMGVFNVLKTPQIAFSQQLASFRQGFDAFGNPTTIRTYNHQYYPSDLISYAINPASGMYPGLSDIQAAVVLEVSETPFITPFYYFTSENTIIEEEKRGILRTFRTKYVPINNVTDLGVKVVSTVTFPQSMFDQISKVYLKVVATLSDGQGHQTVFVSKFKTNFGQFGTMPTSLQNISEDIVINSGIANNVRAWNTATINSGATFSSSGISVIAGNSVALTPGAALTNQASMKAGTPNGNPTVITQGDPSSICVSSTYVTKSTQFARQATELDEPEKVFQLNEKETTAFPNPTTGKVSFRYYVEEPSQVRLNIISTTGSAVATPVSEYQEAGPYEISYDASNLPDGIYIYTLETSKGKETKRLVVIK